MKKGKKHKCRNCGRVRLEKFMMTHTALHHGVDVQTLYPNIKHGRQEWECGDCEENIKLKILNLTTNEQ